MTDFVRDIVLSAASAAFRQPITAEDHFLELGGDSLLAADLLTRLADALDRDVPIEAIFRAGTFGELADLLETKDQL